MADLTGKTPANTYKDLLQVSNSNSGVDGTLRQVEDGEGTQSALFVSTSAMKVSGNAEITGTLRLNSQTYTFPSSAGAASQVLHNNGSNTLYWASAQGGAGSGEVNTGANINVSGVGVYDSKATTTLQFRGINAASGLITVTHTTANNTIDINAVESAFTLTNIGGILSVAKGGTGSETAASARSALGLGVADTPTFASVYITNGGGLRTGQTGGDTLAIQAYDVDGAAYTTFATLVAGNTPTFNLNDAVTKANQYIYRAAGTDVAVADGGTGESSIASARTAFGLAPGTDIQTYSLPLTQIATAATGIAVKTSANGMTVRTITAADAKITVTNGDGAGGNPTIGFGSVAVADLSNGSSVVLNTRQVSAGLGLSGGGDLSSDRTLALALNELTTAQSVDSANQFIPVYNVSSSTHELVKMADLPTGAGGEINTGSNVNVSGVGVFNAKSGVDLQFRGVNPASNKLSVTLVTANNTIDIDAVEANFTLTNLGGTLSIAKGGTGANTAASARTELGLAIGTNVQAYSAVLSAYTTLTTGMVAKTSAGDPVSRVLTAGSNKISISNGDGTGGNPTFDAVEANFTLTNIGGTLSIAKGGTGANTAASARTELGLAIGTNVQAYSAVLSAYTTLTTGFVAKTSAGDPVSRVITAADAKITVTNGAGFGGNPTIGFGAVASTDLSDTATLIRTTTLTAALPPANTTQSGIIEVATTAEVNTGTDTGRAVSPSMLSGSTYGTRYITVMLTDVSAAVSAKNNYTAPIVVPPEMDGWSLVSAAAGVGSPGTTGTTTFQIRHGVSAMLSTPITVSSGDTKSVSAATQSVVSTANRQVSAFGHIFIDCSAITTTPPMGATILMTFRRL